MYQIHVICGGRKRPVPKGATYGKPVRHGVNQLKFAQSLQSVAEQQAGRHCGALRGLTSYWVGEDSTGKLLEVTLIDPSHEAIGRNPDTQWVTRLVHKHGVVRGLPSVALGRAVSSTALLVVLEVQLEEGTTLSSSTIATNMCRVCNILI